MKLPDQKLAIVQNEFDKAKSRRNSRKLSVAINFLIRSKRHPVVTSLSNDCLEVAFALM